MSLNVLVLGIRSRVPRPKPSPIWRRPGTRCSDATTDQSPAFPCSALTDDGCPLRRNIVDVALTVRQRPRSQPAPQEDGVTCALRTHVPLVVAGATA